MRLSRGAQRLLDLLRWYGSRFRRIHPKQEKLATHLKVKIRQLRYYVRELVDATLLLVRKCGRNSAEYELLAQEKCRSSAGLVQVEAVSSSMNVSVPHTARVERKPPRKETACDRLIQKLIAEERACPGTHTLPGESIPA
jgi:hypothetical protein